MLNTETGEAHQFEYPGKPLPSRAIAFSQDGAHIAVAFHDKAIIWTSGVTGPPTVIDNDTMSEPIVSMTFSHDGSVLITQPIMREAFCWRWKTKELVGKMGGRGKQVLHSPDGTFLGFCGSDYVAHLWDVFKREDREVANNAAELAFSADNRFVAIASPEHFARIWRLPELTVAHTMRHNAEVWSLDFSPDSSLLVTRAKDNVARIWSTLTGEEVARIVQHDSLSSARFLADSRHVLTHTGDNSLTLWGISELREVELLRHQVAVLGVTFSADRKYLATHARQGWGSLVPLLIDIESRQPVSTIDLEHGGSMDGTEYAKSLLEHHDQASCGKARSPNGKLSRSRTARSSKSITLKTEKTCRLPVGQF